jgi:hypothetical protein
LTSSRGAPETVQVSKYLSNVRLNFSKENHHDPYNDLVSFGRLGRLGFPSQR